MRPQSACTLQTPFLPPIPSPHPLLCPFYSLLCLLDCLPFPFPSLSSHLPPVTPQRTPLSAPPTHTQQHRHSLPFQHLSPTSRQADRGDAPARSRLPWATLSSLLHLSHGALIRMLKEKKKCLVCDINRGDTRRYSPDHCVSGL